MAAEDIGGIQGEASLDISQVTTAVQKYSDLLKQVNANMGLTEQGLIKFEDASDSAGQSVTKLSDGFSKLLPQFTAAGVASQLLYRGISDLSTLLKQAFTEPIKQAAAFQQTMANVSSLIRGDATTQMKAFNDQILQLSRTIPRDPNDLGAGLYQVVSAGFTKTADAMTVLTASAKGAVAGLTDTKTAVDAVTTVLNAYKMGADQATHVTDSMQVAVDDGKITWTTLADSMGLVVSTAALSKVPLDQMNAALVTLSLAGQQTSHAATDLNMFLDSVIKASNGTNSAAKEAKSLGIEYNTTALQAMGLANFIKMVNDAAGGNEDILQKLVPDVRGFRAVAVLAGSGLDTFNKTLGDMHDKAGAADEAFQKNIDTLKNDWTLVWNNVTADLMQGAESDMPNMQKAVENLMVVIQNNAPEIEDAAKNFTDLAVNGMQVVADLAPYVIGAIDGVSQSLETMKNELGTILNDIIPGLSFAEEAAGAISHFLPHPKANGIPEIVPGPPGVDMTAVLPKTGSSGGAGGGAGSAKAASSALSDAKSVLSDMQSIEKDIISSYGEEAKANKQRIDDLKAALELKKEMGIITPEEQLQLDRINHLVDYQKNAVADATQAWKDQKKVVDELQKKIADYQKQIATAATDLQKQLDSIDDSAAKSKADEVAKLLQEKHDIETKAVNGGLSGDQSYRLGQINAELATADSASLTEGTKLAAMNPLQKIDYDAQKQKDQAIADSKAKTDALHQQLAQAQADLAAAQKVLQQKIDAVTAAQQLQQKTVTTSYNAIEKATAQHVASQIAKLDEERSHVDALAASYSNVASYIADPLKLGTGSSTKKTSALSGFADGGLISGPGTGTSDSIIARLSNGEYVMPAASTAVYRPILDAMRTMSFSLPRFATGGMVQSVKHDRRVSLVQHFHGDAARIMSRPDLVRWELRLAERLR